MTAAVRDEVDVHATPSARAPAGPWARALGRGLALLVVGALAKVILAGMRLADGAAAGLGTPWALPAMLAPEVWAAAAFTLVDAAILALATWLKRPGLEALSWGLYALAAIYIAGNLPIARQFSTPMTFAFFEAAGGALGDSIAGQATATNLLGPALVLAAAIALARRPPRPHRRVLAAIALALALVVALGPIGRDRSDTLGLHRSPILTIAATTWTRAFPPPTPAAVADFDLEDEGDALDLTHLRGSARGFNVIWVILESTGARYLRPYGADLDATPQLSRLAADAIVFERAYTTYPESIKSLLAVLCARPPAPHRAAARFAAAALPCPAIAAELGARGYRSGLFHSGRFVYLGMQAMIDDRGFDVAVDAETIGGRFASSFGTDDRSTVRRLLEWIDEGPAARPFFALYMPIAGHHPYRTPGDAPRPFPATSEFEHYRNDLFVGDAALGELIAGIDARGLAPRTLWVVMGDHGEAFRQHEGNVAHSLFLYEENVHIPLIVRIPGATRGLRAPQIASTIDVGPTIFELLGLPAPAAWRGRSLLEPAAGAARFFGDHHSDLLGLRHGDWKFILDRETGRRWLFDLADDPGETIDRGAMETARADRYEASLRAWAAELARGLDR